MFKSKTVSKFLNMVCKILNIGQTSEVLVTLLIMYYCMNLNLYAKLHFLSISSMTVYVCIYNVCIRIYVFVSNVYIVYI